MAAVIKIKYCVKIHMEQEMRLVMSNMIQRSEKFYTAWNMTI